MQIFDFNHNFEFWFDNSFIISESDISYHQFSILGNQTIEMLSELGINSGEKVAILTETKEIFLILFFALLQMGSIAIPLNKKLPDKQIGEMLKGINCRKLIVDNPNFNRNFKTNIKILQIEKLIKSRKPEDSFSKLKPISSGQDSTIIFTSGSSGNPKAVLHTFGNHLFSAIGSNENIPFDSGDKWLLSLPLFHVGGLSIFFRALIGGGAVVIPDENLDIVQNLKKYNVSHVSLVATQLMKLIDNETSLSLLKNLKCILIGGSSIPSHLIEKSIKHNLAIYTTYGSTEMASQVTTTQSNDLPEKLYTSGNLLKHRELKIVEDGEILVKGKTLFKGFAENDKLIKPFDSEGWYHTGDLGEFDSDNYLKVIGRKDNMFISGGENIYPEEIEKCLMTVLNIEEAVVIEIPDKKYGSRPIAFLKTNNYDSLKRIQIRKILSEHLPKYKIPDRFYKWPAGQFYLKPKRADFISLHKNQDSGEIE